MVDARASAGGTASSRAAIAAVLALGLTATPAVAGPQAAGAEFDNESIVKLVAAGVGEDVLLAKIAGLSCAYDVSTDQLILLKRKGVPNAVIAAMVERCAGASRAQGASGNDAAPTAKRTPGLYLDLGRDGAHDIRVIRPTIASGGRVTGNGSLLFPYTTKLAIARESAQMSAPAGQPRFYFHFETDDRKVGDFGTSQSVAAQSPSEFSLLRLKVGDGQRELVVGKVSAFGGRVGIDPKHAIQFGVEEIGDGVFAVRPASALASGEYAFVLRMGDSAYRLYDFRVP